MIIWYETDRMRELDDFVEKWFSKPFEREWDRINASHYSGFKHEASMWLEDTVALFEELQEMVDALPDDEVEEYPDKVIATSTKTGEENE